MEKGQGNFIKTYVCIYKYLQRDKYRSIMYKRRWNKNEFNIKILDPKQKIVDPK